MNTLTLLFDKLWNDYSGLNPQAKKIHQLLKDEGESIVNDHVAFRTFQRPGFGLQDFAQTFLDLGYQAKDEYFFEEKKLYARHFEHSDPLQPKVFISELLVDQFSSQLQDQVQRLLQQVDRKRQGTQLCTWGRPWKLRFTDYQKLAGESEYAAWLAAWGFCANHFTVSVNALKKFDRLEKLNPFLQAHGFKLNPAGGEIKGNPEVYLEQSSTLAASQVCSFEDGEQIIPSCYYEFALRYPLPEGGLYQGFVEKSADKIFESTTLPQS